MSFGKKYCFFILCDFLALFDVLLCNELYSEEVRSLSELPLNKLIQIKTSLEADDTAPQITDEQLEEETEMEGRMSITLPMAMQLKKYPHRLRSIKRHGEWEPKEHDNKISKIFHFALTTLAFLAFGGYLLALIISSIRRNAVTGTGNVIVLSNLQNLQKYQRPRRQITIINPVENDFDIDRAYHGMIMLSRGYASYNNFN